MNDLISRSEVNDVIDKLEVYTSGRPNTMKVEISVLQLQRFINKLKNIPTAYDVDKVAGELKKHEDTTDLTTVDEEMVVGFTIYQGAFNDAIDKAIEIVKAGGKNE